MAEKTAADLNGAAPVVSSENANAPLEETRNPWWHIFLVWGSAPQIILAALLAPAIGSPVSMLVDEIPKEAPVYLNILIPLIVSATILAVYKLRIISRSGRALAAWTNGYYPRDDTPSPLPSAIYFPIVVVFLTRTQGLTLNAIDYVIITAAATLSSIGTTPIPSSSLPLFIMIAGLVGVPVTGMMGVVFAIAWLLDRFRTALNVSGDLFGAMVVYKKTDIEVDAKVALVMEGQPMREEAPRYNQSMA